MSEMANNGTALQPAQRVLVLGCPGAGKSTFARRLSEQTGLPVYHLDDEYWGPDWARPTDPHWRAKQEALSARERWIIEGNYLPTIAIRARTADLIIVVHAPTLTCLRRVMFRAWRIRRGHYDGLPAQVREQARAGQRVRATQDFLWLVRKIVRFHGADWRELIANVRATSRAPLVVAVAPGPSGRRTRTKLRRMHERDEMKVFSMREAAAFAQARATSSIENAAEHIPKIDARVAPASVGVSALGDER